MQAKQQPKIERIEGSHLEGEVHRHPAFGVISLVASSGGPPTLFGSDIGHNQRLSIQISTAKLNRGLHRDWIHAEEQIVKVELSHAQFARFITSNGQGDGVPCTLTWRQGVGCLPAIEKVETAHATASREIEESAASGLGEIRAEVSRLGELLESGKLGKKELRDIHRLLAVRVENLPKNLAFSVDSAQKALERATSDAKIEVESFISMTAQRLGMQELRRSGLPGADAEVGLRNASAVDLLEGEAS